MRLRGVPPATSITSQYILWRRFVSVWEHRMNGVSLSEAAHAAGFADSAHLTRTSRRMFGVPPSAMGIAAAASGVAAAAPGRHGPAAA